MKSGQPVHCESERVRACSRRVVIAIKWLCFRFISMFLFDWRWVDGHRSCLRTWTRRMSSYAVRPRSRKVRTLRTLCWFWRHRAFCSADTRMVSHSHMAHCVSLSPYLCSCLCVSVCLFVCLWIGITRWWAFRSQSCPEICFWNMPQSGVRYDVFCVFSLQK